MPMPTKRPLGGHWYRPSGYVRARAPGTGHRSGHARARAPERAPGTRTGHRGADAGPKSAMSQDVRLVPICEQDPVSNLTICIKTDLAGETDIGVLLD